MEAGEGGRVKECLKNDREGEEGECKKVNTMKVAYIFLKSNKKKIKVCTNFYIFQVLY